MRGLLAIGALATLLLAAGSGCGGRAPSGALLVATSVLPHAGLVERVGGAHVRVVTLVGPGESPETYQPSDAQVSEVLRARVYFRTGVPFERGGFFDVLARTPTLRVVDLREGVDLRAIEGHDHGAGAPASRGGVGPDREALDPHIWLDPGRLAIQAGTVARVLSEIDPAHAGDYAGNLAALRRDLERLDERLRRVLGARGGGRLYVFHPAWGYLCDAYGIEQRAIEIEGKEPSESELTALVAAARADGVRTIFVQSQIRGRTARTVAEALGADLREVDPLARDVVENLAAVADLFAEALR